MKSLLHKLNIFKKNKNIKKIKQKLKNIDDKNDKAKEIEQQKRAKTEKWFAHWEKKRKELWNSTFLKDYHFADELETIGKHVKNNTNLDVSIYYSKKEDLSDGLICFSMGKIGVSLTVADEKTFNVRTYELNGNHDISETKFNAVDIDKCKEFMKKQILKTYEEQTQP